MDAPDWPELEPRYRALLAREIDGRAALEELLLERSELDAAVGEAGSRAYIRMTCHTDDGDAKREYLRFVGEVEPEVKKAGFELDRKVVASPHAQALDPRRYEVLLRDLRSDVELFRPENVTLQAEDQALFQAYSECTGAQSIGFRGETLTMQQAARFYDDPDRETRRAAWLACSERRLRDREAIDGIFDRMVALRTEIARNAGFTSYGEYVFREKHRFDYTREDCQAFHDAIEEHCVPLRASIQADHARALGLDALMPWDVRVDPHGRDPLRPFEGVDELVAGTSRVFHRLDPELGGLFDSLRDGDSLDLESRSGKAPGGYQITLEHARRPFVFMNAAGVDDDLRIIVHEAGHAFHVLLGREEPLLHYRDTGAEISETASMTMELLTHPYLDEFYGATEADRARRKHLETVVGVLCWSAHIDAFQHWMYDHPDHTRDERADRWVALHARFRAGDCWEGLADNLRADWQRVPHFFSVPFYFIEYGIAQLAALQIWQRSLEDEEAALADYKRALRLGGSRPLPALFRAAGVELDFSARAVRRSADALRRALGA